MIKNLVISGGSTKTIAVLGCLKYLEEQNLMAAIKNYIGTSAGSILCFFLVLGYDVSEIIHLLKEHLFGNNLHVLGLEEVLTLEILQSYGMDSGKNLIQFLTDILFLKFRVKDMTFIELAKTTGKNLVVCGANITKEISEYLCLDTHPEMSVITAVRISVSLPFIFTPVIYKDCYYLDGGIFEMLPVAYIEKFTDPIKDTIALNTISKKRDKNINSLLDYIRTVINVIIDKANQSKTEMSEKIKMITIEFEDVDDMNFSFEDCRFVMDMERITHHIDKGYNIIKQHFEK